MINSPKLDSMRESQECTLPDGDILNLYNSLAEEHKESFETYVKEKLKRDPWAQEIIEEQICTNFKALQLIESGQEYTRQSGLERMKAANDGNYLIKD